LIDAALIDAALIDASSMNPNRRERAQRPK
jgi:hypothetical protein